MRYRFLFLLTALWTCYLPLFAQPRQYQFTRIDIKQGLSNNQVNSIIQDKKGFMWFGTASGLNRYDGFDFKVFKNDLRDSTSITDNFVQRILELPGGKLGVNTFGGFCIYDPLTEQFNRNYLPLFGQWNIPDEPITDIKKDAKGNYWFLMGRSGLYKYSSDHQKAIHVLPVPAHQQGMDSTAIAGISINTKNNIWLIYRDGFLEELDSERGEVVYTNSVLVKENKAQLFSYSLYIDMEDELWITAGTEPHGVFYFDPLSNTLLHFHKDAEKLRMNSNIVTGGITEDAKGIVWIGTDHGGINLVNKKDLSVTYLLNNTDDDKSVSQNSLYSMYKDNTGIIWIGTYKQGLDYYNESSLKFSLFKHRISDPNSLPYEDVDRFAEDAKGNIWIGTNGGGLIYFDRLKDKFVLYRHNALDPNSLSNDVIVSLWIDHTGKLWIGTYFGGMDCYDGKKFIHYRHDPAAPGSLADDRVWEIMEDSKQNLWVGTLSGGLDRFDRQQNIFYHYTSIDSTTILSNYISSLLEDRQGNIWVGTAYGLSVLNEKTGRFLTYLHDNNNPQSISNNNIIDIRQDSRGLFWIGTREGLNLFDPSKNTFKTFRKENGLPDNTILTILEDNSHNMWVSTPNGLCNVIIKKSDKDSSLTFSFKNYDEADGLQGREFNENAAFKTSKGELIFGGPYGFNIFNPGQIIVNKDLPAVVLTDLQIFNKSVGVGENIDGHVILTQAMPETGEITLRYNENVFSLQFTALAFSQGEKSQYAYMLEGFNKGWLTANGMQRKATYTNLDPGVYTFRVKAANGDGVWNEKGVVLKITILPPFWRTYWAFLIYAFLIVAALFLARNITVQRTHLRFRMEQQKNEADRMHALDMLKIKFFTNVSHEFRTPLSLIITPLEKMLKHETDADQKKHLSLIHRNARRLLNLVNQLLDFRRMEVQEFTLDLKQGDIIKFIRDITYSFSDISEKKNIHFSFQSGLHSLETFFDKDKLEKILFNLLSNAFKFTHNNGRIDVEVNLQNREAATGGSIGMLEIKVKDTGIGIPAENHEKIFERFFQHDVPDNMLNQGSGIGLAITKEFVKLNGGSIHVESEPEIGTCFIVLLPVKTITDATLNDQPVQEEIKTPVPDDKTELDEQALNHRAGNKKATVLLVEDNEDFRFYLKDNLREHFNILEAGDGKEGWEKVLTLHPDLVVSDIMMPEMNGIELSRRIKNDHRSSHIPIILLTAMINDEQQLEGYETGANDYITKPFSFEILLSRIRNLLTQRKQLRKAFQKQLEINPGKITVTPLDEKFIQLALEAVEKNISNTEFSVEELSRGLFMSRVALYKKLLSLTGKTPIEFIRIIRLKRAAQLLEKSQLTIAEIAYEVGFNNPKYFTRYFKEEFGMLPSVYQNEKKKPRL